MSFRSKRHRTSSQSSSSTSTSTPESSHPSKASRTVPVRESASGAVAHPLLCTLPPTCNHRPTPIANTKDLEAHYATYHAHVCEESGCSSVFPDPRLLELHQTECHDPIAAVRKDRGEKIFACHLASCARLFLTPKARRLHLIQAHGYPKEYFFAVTNKGVGGLLKRWGEGVSLIRGPWKARDGQENKSEDGGDNEDSLEGYDMVNPVPHKDSQNDKRDQEHDGTDDEEKNADKDDNTYRDEDASVDGLTRSMGSLNLVPPSIRFGRGGKSGGFTPNGRTGDSAMDSPARGGHFRGRGRGRGWHGAVAPIPGQVGGGDVSSPVMEIDSPSMQRSQIPSQGRGGYGSRGGLGWAGRGQAGIVHVPMRGRGHRGRGRAVAMIAGLK